jgi:hypothetical protein
LSSEGGLYRQQEWQAHLPFLPSGISRQGSRIFRNGSISKSDAKTRGLGGASLWGSEGFSSFETIPFERPTQNKHRRSYDRSGAKPEKTAQKLPGQTVFFFRKIAFQSISPIVRDFFNRLNHYGSILNYSRATSGVWITQIRFLALCQIKSSRFRRTHRYQKFRRIRSANGQTKLVATLLLRH